MTAVSPEPEMMRGLQERVARALPADRVDHAGGWWLRHATSSAWWISTVLPHSDDAAREDLAERVVRAEEFYAGHGAPARFQITPLVCPDPLDALLAERGYRREGELSLWAAPTTRVLEQEPANTLRVRVDDAVTRAWFDVWQAVQGQEGAERTEWDMLTRVSLPSAYVGVLLGDEVVAVGRAVADGGWAGVFGMATLLRARGLRAGRRVLAALAEWAHAQGADRLYLQVERGNAPALRLYGGAGFDVVCDYHYRTMPSSA